MSLPTKGGTRATRLLRVAVALVAAAITVVASAGTAAAAQPDHGGRIASRQASGPPWVSVTVHSTATVTSGGTVLLSGQLTCGNARHVRVRMSLKETVNGARVRAQGHIHSRGDCDGQAHPWVTALMPGRGKFTSGSARWHAHATAFSKSRTRHASASDTISLSG